MKKHTKIYLEHFGYDKTDFIPCEICNSKAVDIHHIECRGMGGSFNGIMISGRDEKNIGMFFNNNLFTRKIDIEAPIDENEMFNRSDVFSRIITKIEEEINAND